MMPVPDHAAQLARVLGGHYRIDALLGVGGMGAVYRGLQLSVQRPVAIKLISGASPDRAELVSRFRREAEATARLSHPNTVRLIDFGVTDDDELFMVMELLDGFDLATLLRRGPLPPLAALRIVRQVLLALCEAHALGIVHRDLKPDNVFLSRVQGAETFVKVMDFGIAGLPRTRDAPRLTFTGEVMGTPAYMSPEQAQGRAVDARSDLYSIGVMLFEMLSGAPPFANHTLVSLLVAHVTRTPPRLDQRQLALPLQAELQRLLDALLAKQPDDRPPSAASTLEWVDALIERYQASPQPSAAARRRLSPGQRRRVWLAGVGLAVVAAASALWMFGTPARSRLATSAGPPPSAAASTAPQPSVARAAPPSAASRIPPPSAASRIPPPSAASSARQPPSAAESSVAAATDPPRQRALAFTSFAAARKAYDSGAIDAAAYADALAMLKRRRDELIEDEKAALKSGKITPQQYADHIARIDARLRGE
jgi:serine/threonine-protein kinase